MIKQGFTECGKSEKKKNVDKLGFSSFQLKISFSIPPKRKGEGGRERNLYFSTEIFDNK